MDFKIREIRTAQGPKKLLREREEYFRLMQQGFSNGHACQIVGINAKSGRGWRNAVPSASRRRHPGSAGGAAFWSVQVSGRG